MFHPIELSSKSFKCFTVDRRSLQSISDPNVCSAPCIRTWIIRLESFFLNLNHVASFQLLSNVLLPLFLPLL